MELQSYEERGYLRENFRLFHLADDRQADIAFHYHSFHKIVWLLAGRADYCIEGQVYQLQPGDCVLVGRGNIHRPQVKKGDFYERVILYISPAFLQNMGAEDLEQCFTAAQRDGRYVYHDDDVEIRSLLLRLEQAIGSEEFGAALLARALFMELIVAVNRMAFRAETVEAAGGDRKMLALLKYLGGNLAAPPSIDELAERFYISKYHMMRRFREATGYTIHSYITEKRLLLAQELLGQGLSLTETADRCGYQDYSTFSRAYKKQFGHSPSLKPAGSLPPDSEFIE